MAAIATVLFLAMLHAPSPSKDATVGRADALAKAERMVAQQRWSDAVAVALQYLAQYPEERRLRFVLSQSLAGLGNADQALLHLSMAATPPVGADSRVALGSPSREEVWQALRQLEADHDAQLTSDWAHFRKARVAAFCGQFEKRDIELSAISRGARQSDADLQAPFYQDILGKLISAPLTATAQESLLRMIKVHRYQLPIGTNAPAQCVAVAGGAYTGLDHQVLLGSAASRHLPVNAWWFMVLNEEQEPVEERQFDFSPLSRDVDDFKRWLDGIPRQAALLGLVSGEILMATSNQNRVMLRETMGLATPGRPELLCAYVFVSAPSEAGRVVHEVQSTAPDVPAILAITKAS